MGVKRLIRNAQCSVLGRFTSFDPSQSITVFSDPRGGSTWLTEMLASIPGSVVIWEPLHHVFNPRIKKVGFSWRQYIPENEIWSEARSEFDRIMSGKVLNPYTTFLNQPHEYLRSKQLIVKYCRGNALLPWFVNQYSLRYKPIYLIRHPFSVVASQMLQGGWNFEFNRFEVPQNRYNEYYLPHIDFLGTIRSKEESLVANWCLSNSVPLKSIYNNEKWITVYYENLYLDPVAELERIFSIWGLQFPIDLYEKIDRDSVTSISKISKDKFQQLSKWKNQFNEVETDRLLRILQYFEVGQYNSDILPSMR